MTKVFVVTQGTYSDFSLEGIFSSRELAETFSSALPNTNGVGEWELDAIDIRIKQGLRYYLVVMQGNGDSEITLQDPEYCNQEDRRMWDWKDPRAIHRNNKAVRWLDEWNIYCWAKDEQHAAKIANERRGAMIASGKWYEEPDLFSQKGENK